ncbi:MULTISPECIES: hypothetical protein [Fischerella]|uniref:hypothetical protein n=1 Tax=Fischerella TaxID=1190 RepID=UPI000381088A|nr:MULTISPECIES: hypothetical protein [Fischerella]
MNLSLEVGRESGRVGEWEVGRWGDGELTGPHSPKGVGIRGSGEMGRWGVWGVWGE